MILPLKRRLPAFREDAAQGASSRMWKRLLRAALTLREGARGGWILPPLWRVGCHSLVPSGWASPALVIPSAAASAKIVTSADGSLACDA